MNTTPDSLPSVAPEPESAIKRSGRRRHTRPVLASIGASCLLASIVLWIPFLIAERRDGNATAAHLLTAFPAQNDLTERQLAGETEAEVQLSGSNRSVRVAFLRQALKNPQ